MNISTCYRIEERDQNITLGIIRSIGFEEALEEAFKKALYLVANTPTSTLATEWLAWSHNLLEDSRKLESEEVSSDLRLLASFYRKLAHKVYWYLKRTDQLGEMRDFIRLVD